MKSRKNIAADLFKAFLQPFYPQICANCGEISEKSLCENCIKLIKKINNPACLYCGAFQSPDPGNKENVIKYKHGEKKLISKNRRLGLCSRCMQSDWSFYRLRSYGIYEGVLKKAIIRYKYNKIKNLASIFADFLAETFFKYYRNEKIDFIETVCGYNLSEDTFFKSNDSLQDHMKIIARNLSDNLKLPYKDNVIKIRKTFRQQNMGYFERKINIKGAFKLKNSLAADNKNILLIDDVWTTGSTLNEISRVFKNCGAKKIYLLTLARGI